MKREKLTPKERKSSDFKKKTTDKSLDRPVTEEDLNSLLEHFGQKRAYPK